MPSYIPCQADADLLDGLTTGEFCDVLTSRQMGQSSLMVRTAASLREAGAAVATPSDLIRDPRTTPFNIGRRVELTDFA